MRDGFPIDRFDPRVRVMASDPFPDPFPAPLPISFRLPPSWSGRQPAAAECPAFERRSARWQESSYIARPGPLFLFHSNVCVEVARFTVPQGCTGIIHRIALSVEVMSESEPPEPEGLFYLGLDPFALDRISPWAGGGVRFHLRLEPYNQDEDRSLGQIVTDQGMLPGQPHPELGSWNDSRYWFGFAAAKTRIRVPEKSRASLWFELGITDEMVRDLTGLYGLLQGHTWQYTGNPAAYKAAQDGL